MGTQQVGQERGRPTLVAARYTVLRPILFHVGLITVDSRTNRGRHEPSQSPEIIGETIGITPVLPHFMAFQWLFKIDFDSIRLFFTRMPDRMPDRMSEYMSDRMPDRTSEYILESMSELMPGRMPEKMSDRMSEYMSERMSDRMIACMYMYVYIYIYIYLLLLLFIIIIIIIYYYILCHIIIFPDNNMSETMSE